MGEQPDITTNITTKRILFHHFPYGKHDKCCSTEEDKAKFLKDCNKIFSDYDIKCTNTKPGSIIVEYETFLKNTEEVMKKVFSKVDKIGDHCPTDDHESEESMQKRIRDEKEAEKEEKKKERKAAKEKKQKEAEADQLQKEKEAEADQLKKQKEKEADKLKKEKEAQDKIAQQKAEKETILKKEIEELKDNLKKEAEALLT